jgi:hypothetical protein
MRKSSLFSLSSCKGYERGRLSEDYMHQYNHSTSYNSPMIYAHSRLVSSLYSRVAELMTGMKVCACWRLYIARSISNLCMAAKKGKKKKTGQKFLEEPAFLLYQPSQQQQNIRRRCWWFRQNDGVTHAANLMKNEPYSSAPVYRYTYNILVMCEHESSSTLYGSFCHSSFVVFIYISLCLFLSICVYMYVWLAWCDQAITWRLVYPRELSMDGYDRPYSTQYQHYILHILIYSI